MPDRSPKKTQLPQHRARKRFGQNFLTDQGVIHRIVRSIAPKVDDNLVEIGPGKGALTQQLIEACPGLNVIEIDRDLIPILLAQFAKYPDFKIHREDALKFDFKQLVTDQALRVTGNLPYNISTPLIFHLLSFHDQIQDMHFMLQKEVVERLSASPGDSHYGRLSVMVQYYCRVDYLFDVPPESFSPQPKVDSAIVRLAPMKELPAVAINIDHFNELVKTTFQLRRKTLRNSLKKIVDKEIMEALPFDLQLRPENLSVKDYVDLSNFIVSKE
jgi:16S rRNA (adenine1518-N6/adenine1519-N6)-dimethyltransferase